MPRKKAKDALDQLALFLDLKPKEIGQIGGGKRKPNGMLDVAMIQSLARKDIVDDIVATYGHVIVDECHHVPAVSFERVMRAERHLACPVIESFARPGIVEWRFGIPSRPRRTWHPSNAPRGPRAPGRARRRSPSWPEAPVRR